MFCRSCKKKIDDDSLYCKYCGSPQDSSQLKDGLEDKFDPMKEQFVQQFNAKKEERKPMNPMVKKIIIGVAALFVLVIGIISGYKKFHKEKIDIDEFIKINCAGYDGNGVVSYEFDEKKFSKKLKDSLGIASNKDLEEIIAKNYGKYKALDKCITDMKFKLDKDSKLSNGEEVVLTIKYDNKLIDKYGIKFTGGKIKYKVKKLDKIREIDPFEELEVKFEGYSPEVKLVSKNNSKEECLKDIYFKSDKSSYLREGDEVTITALHYDEDEYREKYGVKFTQTEKQYKVENVSKYVLSIDEIDDDFLSEIYDHSEDKIKEYFEKYKKAIEVKGKINFEGYYFLNVKQGKEFAVSEDGDYYGQNYGNYNVMYVVYSATVHDKLSDGDRIKGDEREEPFADTKVYLPVEIENIVKHPNGEYYFDYDLVYLVGYSDLSFYYDNYYESISGYKTLKSMKNDLIDSEYDHFDYVSNGLLDGKKENKDNK